jgi:hypothetical protein
MSLVMLVSFIATRMTPETVDRDLTDPEDAQWNNKATAENAAPTEVMAAQHAK